MKEEQDRTVVLLCACSHPEHQIQISGDEDSLWVQISLNSRLSIFKRACVALAYIFRPGYRMWHFDDVVLSVASVEKMMATLNTWLQVARKERG